MNTKIGNLSREIETKKSNEILEMKNTIIWDEKFHWICLTALVEMTE